MEIRKVEEIVKLLKEYDLKKICVENDNFKVEIENYENVTDDVNSIMYSNKKSINKESQIVGDNKEYVVKSPLVGIVNILENKSECKNYSVGDRVERGQTICTIEAMKMINEVNCNQDGIITEILIENNQFVEYEQPLFKIRERTKNV